MNINRHRNVFTLGSQEVPKTRRQLSDPFERDPFKIQSYNFRYAERPNFPMSALGQRPGIEQRNCETYFYNYDFPNANNANKEIPWNHASPNDAGAQNLTKFEQYRKRRFLNDLVPHNNSSCFKGGKEIAAKACQNSQTVHAVTNLYNDKTNLNSTPTTSLRRNGNTSTFCQNESNDNFSLNMDTHGQVSVVRDELRPPASRLHISRSQPGFCVQQSMPFSSNNIAINADRVPGSAGCVININIKGLENSSQRENVNIKINTDSAHNNITLPPPLTHNNKSKSAVNRLSSGNSYVLSKRLSKFTSNLDKRIDRAKNLTSIYSSTNCIKSLKLNNYNSYERLPSLITCKSNDGRRNRESSLLKENFSGGKKASSVVTKFRDNSSHGHNNHNKNIERSASHHIFGNSFNNLDKSRAMKLSESSSKQSFMNKFNKGQHLPTAASMHCLASPYKSVSPLILRNAKLPLNVNINLFTDKLKLLKV